MSQTHPPLEGVTKFEALHRAEKLNPERFGARLHDFLGWRRLLFEAGAVGQDPKRYDGAGYGNLSFRLTPYSAERGARSFLITGTQTGGLAQLQLSDCCAVDRYDVARNTVCSTGETPPSSESLTHGAIYDLSPAIRFVFHGHIPELWQQAGRLRLPTTRPEVAYGTPAMATEMRRLYRTTNLSEVRCLAMAGHEDGVISFGRSAEEAGRVLISFLARAYGLQTHGS